MENVENGRLGAIVVEAGGGGGGCILRQNFIPNLHTIGTHC